MTTSPMKAVLIVEGHDEHDVVLRLQQLHAIDGLFIEVLKGRDDLMTRVKDVAYDSKYRDVRRVGIIYDSEDDPAQACTELKRASEYLENLEHPKTTKVLQLPKQDESGSFEALCLQAIAQDDPILQCCNQYLACLSGKPHKLSTQARQDKARLLAWYAAKTGKHISRIGRDAVEGDEAFDYAHQAFGPLVTFLQSLVGDTDTGIQHV